MDKELPLITPHGDREPPLCAGNDLLLALLITPHGDREPARPRTLGKPMPRMTHYPSWGSGTRPAPQFPRDLLLALITPHGDRELDSASDEWEGEGLITPHGDRER